jgi:hypothetical protein
MGTKDDAAFANSMGHFYERVALQLDDFMHNNIKSLRQEQRDFLETYLEQAIDYANAFYTLSDKIAFENSAVCFKAVSNATGDINHALEKIKNIDRIIAISAGVITLAGAIAAHDGGGITKSLQSVMDAIKS